MAANKVKYEHHKKKCEHHHAQALKTKDAMMKQHHLGMAKKHAYWAAQFKPHKEQPMEMSKALKKSIAKMPTELKEGKLSKSEKDLVDTLCKGQSDEIKIWGVKTGSKNYYECLIRIQRQYKWLCDDAASAGTGVKLPTFAEYIELHNEELKANFKKYNDNPDIIIKSVGSRKVIGSTVDKKLEAVAKKHGKESPQYAKAFKQQQALEYHNTKNAPKQVKKMKFTVAKSKLIG